MAGFLGNAKAVSTHSRPKAAGLNTPASLIFLSVSTHSRPKAAGYVIVITANNRDRFNSQPPEGGWLTATLFVPTLAEFQLTAARRRLDVGRSERVYHGAVSTHSRPKAAGTI